MANNLKSLSLVLISKEQVDTLIGNHHEGASLVPDGYFESTEKR